MLRGDSSGIKYFFISFSITLIVLTIIFIPIYLVVTPKKIDEGSNIINIVENNNFPKMDYSPRKEDIISILIALTDESDHLVAIYLCGMNPITQQISASSLPTGLIFQRENESVTFERQYSEKGMIGLQNAVKILFDVDVPKYARITKSQFISIVNYIGSLEYLVPENLVYEETDQNIFINIPEGMQDLDGERLYTLMTFPGFDDTVFKHKLYTDIITSYINQRMDRWYYDNIDTIFPFIANQSDSNISIMDHTRYKRAILYTISSDKSIGSSVFLDIISDESGVNIMQESKDLIDVHFNQALTK